MVFINNRMFNNVLSLTHVHILKFCHLLFLTIMCYNPSFCFLFCLIFPIVNTWKAFGSVYTRLKPSCVPQYIWAVSSVHVFVETIQSYRQGLPVGGTPSSWPPASPSPAAPGEHPAAPPRVSLPPAHHAQGRDTIHTEAPPLKRKGGTGGMREGEGSSLLRSHHCITSCSKADMQPTNRPEISSLSAPICHPEVPPGPQADHGLPPL